MNEVSLEELKHRLFYTSVMECNRQSWEDGRKWTGYEEVPRFADGLLLICSEMEAEFSLSDGRVFIAKKGDCVYTPKGSCYRVCFHGGGKGADLYTVNFCLHDSDGNELRLGEAPHILVQGVSPDCYSLADELFQSCVAFHPNRIKQQIKLFSLLHALTKEMDERTEAYGVIRRGVRLLNKEWDQNHTVSRYADACEISETGFYQAFKAWSGTSPVEYRNGMRIAAAKSLLRDSGLSVREIAAQIGFEDAYYFSRLFKKRTGSSPREYRQMPEKQK